MPWKNAAGAEGGITIDIALLNGTVYDDETSTASIMGGTKWGDVYKALKPLGVAVPGGRADTVGVGGLLIGGGLSYFANHYGLACDNVLSFEVALVHALYSMVYLLLTVLSGCPRQWYSHNCKQHLEHRPLSSLERRRK
jgi:FAD/FMN-containing dehydrogenase